MFCEKDVPRNFTKFTGKHLCQSLFFNTVTGLRPATLLKKTLAQVFFCEFCQIYMNSFSYKTPLVAASRLTCKVNSSNLSIQDLLCLLISCWFFLFNQHIFSACCFILNFNHRNHLCVLKNLLYSFVSMLFLKRAVKS